MRFSSSLKGQCKCKGTLVGGHPVLLERFRLPNISRISEPLFFVDDLLKRGIWGEKGTVNLGKAGTILTPQ